jgi:hypothetical protein
VLKCIKNSLFVLLILLKTIASGQVFDSARIALQNEEPGLDIIFGSRFSFFSNQPAVIQSVGLGLSYGKRISFGLCYHWMSNKLRDDRAFFDKNSEQNRIEDARLYFRYLSIYGNLVYHKTKRWKFNIPIHAGIGRTFFKTEDKSLNLRTPKKFLMIYEPAVHVQFKIIRWLGIGANIGFRFVIQREKFVANQFNSPTYALGLSISWDELAKDLFPNNEYVKKLGPKEW